MTPERHAQIKEIFLAACALPAGQRGEFVVQKCGGDAALLEEVNRLLAQHLPGPIPTASEQLADHADAPAKLPSPVPVSPDDDQMELLPTGKIIAGRYRIVTLLGEGGMGQVYRADDLTLEQQVALKFLTTRYAGDAVWRRRFESEVKLSRKVAHPNVCRIHDIGEQDGAPFISMEYIDGENLASILKQVGRLPGERLLSIAGQLCAGLAAAHACDVLHRDLKPANIMLDRRGNVRITDFGLAGIEGEVARAEFRSGTPRYMAPEQLAGKSVSKKSDIYSLGLVLYEMACGQPAFKAHTPQEYLKLHGSETPVLPSKIVPEIDPALEAVILSCLEKDPAARPDSALAVAAGLPGGDLLSAALAAGEIPTPSMLADAAGRQDIVKSRLVGALALFAVAVGMALAVCRLAHPIAAAGSAAAPQVLLKKARDLIVLAGYSENTVDVAYCYAAGVHYSPAVSPVNGPFTIGAFTPTDPLFFYRASFADPIDTHHGFSPFAVSSGEIFEIGRGQLDAVTVALAPDGRLVLFDASNVKSGPADSGTGPPNWPDWVRRAGFDAAAIEPSQPLLPDSGPFGCANERIGFSVRTTSTTSTSLRLEGAARGGCVVYFAVLSEAARARLAFVADPAVRHAFVRALREGVFLILLVASLPVAWRNMRSRGADTTGAMRLAAAIAILRLAADVLATRYVPNLPEGFERVTRALSNALAEGLLVAIFYIALERHIRRAWPHSLIGWSRLLAGRLRDPYVGRDLLAGCVIGALWATLTSLESIVPDWMALGARAPIRLAEEYQYLLGARFALASCCDWIRRAVYLGLLLLLMLVVARVVLGRPRAAAVSTWLIASLMYVPAGKSPLTAWVLFGLGVVALAVLVLIRYGLVTFVCAAVLTRLLMSFPFTLDPNIWYSEYGLFALAVTLAVAIFGFREALRKATSPSHVADPQ